MSIEERDRVVGDVAAAAVRPVLSGPVGGAPTTGDVEQGQIVGGERRRIFAESLHKVGAERFLDDELAVVLVRVVEVDGAGVPVADAGEAGADGEFAASRTERGANRIRRAASGR